MQRNITASKKQRKKKINKTFPHFFSPEGGRKVKKIKTLELGLTNRTYLVKTNSSKYVARIPGNGTDQLINREHESYNTNLVIQAGLSPEVVVDKADGKKITKYLSNPTPLTREILKQPEFISLAAKALKQLHCIPTPFANSINVFERNRELLDILQEQNTPFDAKYLAALEQINRIEEVIDEQEFQVTPTHSDAVPANFILSEGKIQFIDFEYSGNNDPMWDLAVFATEGRFDDEQNHCLLNTYMDNDIDNDAVARFHLYLPVVSYWNTLWCLWRISNMPDCDEAKALDTLKDECFQRCNDILQSPEIENLLVKNNNQTGCFSCLTC